MRSQEFITEATYELDTDVDMLYDLAFKDIVEQIQAGTWDGEDFASNNYIGDTGMLTSPDCKKAHEVNPLTIITTQGNEYNPHGDAMRAPFLSLSINNQVLGLIRDHGSVKSAVEVIPWSQRERFKSEILPERIKGSIHHELAHWLDDTFHNSHIKNRITWANTANEKHSDYKKASNIMNQGKKQRNLSNYEINAQIHSIKQLKRANEDMWDLLSFGEMVKMNASLSNLSDEFKELGEYENWKKQLLRRMHREKLIGDEMYRTL